MTPEEREKLIDDMAQRMLTVAPSSFWPADDLKDMASAALAIAEAAFERKIREAYKEGWQEARDISSDPNDWEIDWQESNALATILAEKP